MITSPNHGKVKINALRLPGRIAMFLPGRRSITAGMPGTSPFRQDTFFLFHEITHPGHAAYHYHLECALLRVEQYPLRLECLPLRQEAHPLDL